MLETVELQREALDTPVEPRFIVQRPHIKGPYTTGDYVRWQMNRIFGPDNWSHTITQGPELVKVNERSAYVQVTVRVVARFANGQQVTHDDVGVSPLQAAQGADLDGTTPERFETVLKAAVTDAVKACAEYLGTCFRPLGDESLDRYIRGRSRKTPARPCDARPEGAYPQSEVESPGVSERIGPTEFWSRFNELEREGLIDGHLREALEIQQARQTGDWGLLLGWLNTQAKK